MASNQQFLKGQINIFTQLVSKLSFNHNYFEMVVSFKVYKKTSPNGKMTIYLGRRDFVDHVSETDSVDGVLLVDKDYLAGRQVSL